MMKEEDDFFFMLGEERMGKERKERETQNRIVYCAKKRKKTQKKTMKTIVFLVALSLSHAMNSDSWVRSTHVYNLKRKALENKNSQKNRHSSRRN